MRSLITITKAFLCSLLLLHHASFTVANDSEVVTCTVVGLGTIRILVRKDWAPLGAERFLHLVDIGFYDGTALFRAIPNFLVQFGMSKNRDLQNEWGRKDIKDDPLIGTPVTRGTMAFAGSGKDSRSTQVWIAYKESPGLGEQPWETPFGQVIDGMEVIENVYQGYGDGPPYGKGVSQGEIWSKGYEYLTENFPALDYFGTCKRNSAQEKVVEATPPSLSDDSRISKKTTTRREIGQVAPSKPKDITTEAVPTPSYTAIALFSVFLLCFFVFLGAFASRVFGTRTHKVN